MQRSSFKDFLLEVALSAVCGNRICKLNFSTGIFGATLSWQMAVSTLKVLITPRRRDRQSDRSDIFDLEIMELHWTKGLWRVTRAFDFLRAEEEPHPLNVNIIPRIEETGLKNYLLLNQWEQSLTKQLSLTLMDFRIVSE